MEYCGALTTQHVFVYVYLLSTPGFPKFGHATLCSVVVRSFDDRQQRAFGGKALKGCKFEFSKRTGELCSKIFKPGGSVLSQAVCKVLCEVPAIFEHLRAFILCFPYFPGVPVSLLTEFKRRPVKRGDSKFAVARYWQRDRWETTSDRELEVLQPLQPPPGVRSSRLGVASQRQHLPRCNECLLVVTWSTVWPVWNRKESKAFWPCHIMWHHILTWSWIFD